LGNWLVWAAGGWLVYGLGYGLWALVRLGAPVEDWQWYLAVLLLAGWALAWLGGLRRRWMGALLLGIVVWLAAGYGGWQPGVTLHPAEAPPVPLSFWAFGDFADAPEGLLSDLRAAGGRVYLDTRGLEADTVEGKRWLSGLRRLEAAEVPVVLAVTASNFLSVPVLEEWQANVRRAVETVQAAGLTNLAGVLGDAERPVGYGYDWLGLERGRFAETVREQAALQRALRAQWPGLRLGVTAHWAWFVDGLDGDADLARAQRSPVDPPGGWDFVSVMSYSSYLPPADRAYYLVLVERALARLYPQARPSHLIGLVGAGMPGEPLLSAAELVRDAQLSRALGAPEVVVFQLNSALEAEGPRFVADLNAAVNREAPRTLTAPFSRLASGYVFLVCAADGWLNVVGDYGYVWLIYFALCGGATAGVTRRDVKRPNTDGTT
jgi:hypothetical protein